MRNGPKLRHLPSHQSKRPPQEIIKLAPPADAKPHELITPHVLAFNRHGVDLITGAHIGEAHKIKTLVLWGQAKRAQAIENKLPRAKGGTFISLIIRLSVVFPQYMEEIDFIEGGDLGCDFVD